MVRVGSSFAFLPAKAGIFSMMALVFSCAMISVRFGSSPMPPVWSVWACVRIIFVIGRSETACTVSSTARPNPGCLASTSTISSVRTSASELPPPPRNTYSTSRGLSVSILTGC